MMKGAWAAKTFVTDYLTADLPRRLLKYRNEWQVDDDVLGEPQRLERFEPSVIDRWPMVNTVVVSTKSMSRVDYDASLNPEYRVTYVCRTYAWTRGDDAETTCMSRDMMIAVLREALLDYPCLRAADALGRNVAIEEDSMREEFSELSPLKGDRFIAGGYVGYDLSLNETVERLPLGTLDEVRVAVNIEQIQ